MNRRGFIKLCGIGASFYAAKTIAAPFGRNLKSNSQCHLDLAAAKKVKAEQLPMMGTEIEVLELDMFRSATDAGIRHLTDMECGFVVLGLAGIDPEVAAALSEWNCHFIEFENLESLSAQSAEKLVENGHQLVFEKLPSLSIGVAKALANNDGWLVFNSLDSISPEVATSLARHTRALEIRLKNSLNPTVAAELVQHKGHRLTLILDQYPDDMVISALSSNQYKLAPRIGQISVNSKWGMKWGIDIYSIGFDGVY